MQKRSQQDRRIDRLTAERFDLAVLAARAFNVRAGQQYLLLSGISPSLVRRFETHFPDEVHMRTPLNRSERRRSRPAAQAGAKEQSDKRTAT